MEFSNFTLLAGKNSTGKSTVIQAVLALYQDSASSFAGKYMNIGTVITNKRKALGYTQQIIFDCNSGGIPHQHCMDIMIAEKMK